MSLITTNSFLLTNQFILPNQTLNLREKLMHFLHFFEKTTRKIRLHFEIVKFSEADFKKKSYLLLSNKKNVDAIADSPYAWQMWSFLKSI